MVSARAAARILALVIMLVVPNAWGLFPQTVQDLQVAEDRLRYEFGELSDRKTAVTPVLVATPLAHWQESQSDFAPAMTDVLQRTFREPGALIPCAECLQNRVYISNDNRTVIQNGELSLTDLARLRERPGFSQARTVFLSRETPSGIAMKLISIDDGRLLYSGLADATMSLDEAKRPMGLARELERRKRGEALSYVMFDLGIYPKGLVQFKWLEQWGSRNQHLSGVAVGLLNPTGSLGFSYHYMLPARRQITAGLTGYYMLTSLFSGGEAKEGETIVVQGMLHAAISGSYGFFVSVDSQNTFTVGISLLNPVLFPFLL